MGFLTRKKHPTQQSSPPVDHLGYQMASTPFASHEHYHLHQSHGYQSQPPLASSSSTSHFQPAGYLPPPQGVNGPSPAGTSSASNHGGPRPCQPIVVNQHYYLGPPPAGMPSSSPYPSNNGCSTLSKLNLGSTLDLANGMMPCNVANQMFDDQLPKWHSYGTQLLNQGAAMSDQIWSKFNNVMTLIDGDMISGNDKDLFMYDSTQSPGDQPAQSSRGLDCSSRNRTRDTSKGHSAAVASSLVSRGYFSKVELYANSKLPLNLPPLQLYIPSYPLLCLAAQYAEKVYEKPRGAERDVHVNSDWKTGAKAMCIKSVPMDHMDTIVFAIRGTATFMDWAVNLNTAPTSPDGFLDDTGNLCHAGFLSVARKMIGPVAARLRQLLEENPRRASYSLLMTGHSAGGAIASLLYAHMLASSEGASSELNLLTGCFRRVHCITFGAPPVSLLPLQKPDKPQFKKFMFFSFVNEGDPVVRADKAYVKSLLELLAAPMPAPGDSTRSGKHSSSSKHHHSNSRPREKKSMFSLAAKESKMSMKSSSSSSAKSSSSRSKHAGPVWKVPLCPLSNAGRIVLLRSGNPGARIKRTKSLEERLAEGVVAQFVSDEQLRDVIFGDPVCHVMRFYAARIEVLAVGAVTVQGH